MIKSNVYYMTLAEELEVPNIVVQRDTGLEVSCLRMLLTLRAVSPT